MVKHFLQKNRFFSGFWTFWVLKGVNLRVLASLGLHKLQLLEVRSEPLFWLFHTPLIADLLFLIIASTFEEQFLDLLQITVATNAGHDDAGLALGRAARRAQ